MNRRNLTELFEKYMVAVDVLATSPAPIQKRLEGAFKSFVDVESKASKALVSGCTVEPSTESLADIEDTPENVRVTPKANILGVETDGR